MKALIIFTSIIFANANTSNDYTIYQNFDVNQTANEKWLISRSFKQSLYFCLASCNSLRQCLSLIFDNSNLNFNCFLYTKYFSTFDLIPSTDVVVHTKYDFDVGVLFEDYKLNRFISSYNSTNAFNYLNSFAILNNLNGTKFYYVLDSSGNYIAKYDQNWKYLMGTSTFRCPNDLITNIQNDTNELFISTCDGLYQTDEYFTVLNFNSSNNNYQRLHYSISNDHLLVTSGQYPTIYVFSRNLNFEKSISMPYFGYSIVEYNNILYVLSNSGFSPYMYYYGYSMPYIMIFVNETFSNSFYISWYVSSMAYHSRGFIATLGYNWPSNINLYSTNGKYSRVSSWVSPLPSVVNIYFDENDNLIILVRNGLYIFTTKSLPQSSNNVSISNSCEDKNQSLLNVFSSYKVKKSITYSTPLKRLNQPFGSCVVCTSNNSFYVLVSDGLLQFDSNWNYVNQTYFYNPRSMISIKVDGEVQLFVTNWYSIYIFDKNLNAVNNYIASNNEYVEYNGMFYNISSDRLYVCSYYKYRIDVFNRQLTLIKSISTYPVNYLYQISESNNILYISTRYYNVILVMENETITRQFTIPCSSSLLVDKYGYLAVFCNSAQTKVHLYSMNGSYMGISLSNTIPSYFNSISFGTKDEIIVTSYNGIFVMTMNKTFGAQSKSNLSIDVNYSLKNKSFTYAIENYKVQKNITSFSNQPFSQVYSFTHSYIGKAFYVLDYSSSKIIKYDSNWTYLSYANYTNPRELIVLKYSNNSIELILYAYNAIYKLDGDLNFRDVYYDYNYYYGGLYYNSTGDYILVSTYYGIDVLNRADFQFLRRINIGYYDINCIREYNGLLYFTSYYYYHTIFVLYNESYTATISTSCPYTTSFDIDSFGVICLICSSSSALLYSIDGSQILYNDSISSAFSNIFELNFDGFGNLVYSTQNSLYILH